MPELPWEKWYPTNWASEPGLRLCEAATRGIWFEAINTMMLQQTGSISGTLEQLAMLCVCRTSQMQLAIEQLKAFKVSDISEDMQNGCITIACRKRLRDIEIKGLRSDAAKQRWCKGDANVMQGSKTLHMQTSASVYASASDSVQGEGEGRGGRGSEYHKDTRTVLHLLIEGSGKHFREVDCNLSVISARLKEPEVNLEGVRLMIGRQCRLWKGTEMEEYLRPATLFGKQKFDGYYAAREAQVHQKPTEAHNTVDKRQVKEHIVGKLL